MPPKASKPRPMTEEERRFAAEHHDAVYRFLRKKRLNADEYYDIAVFGYLDAVRRYLSEKPPHRHDFGLTAYIMMCDSIAREAVRQNRPMRKGVTVSLETVVYTMDHQEIRLADILPGRDSVEQEIECREFIQEIFRRLTGIPRNIFQGILEGKAFNDILKTYHIRSDLYGQARDKIRLTAAALR